MTIDEAIEMYKKIANTDSNCPRYCMNPCEECVKECKQLAEWLIELKAYREIGTVEECKGCVFEILEAYNKAIDDFKQKILEKAPRNYVGDLELGGSVSFLSANAVTKIAEQLKVGVENEQSI